MDDAEFFVKNREDAINKQEKHMTDYKYISTF